MRDTYRQPDLSKNPHMAQVYSDEGVPIPVADLVLRAHSSIYGQHMDAQPLRFAADFGYDRQTMLSDLGPDVHPIEHQNETARHLLLLIEHGNYNLTGEEIGLLVFKDQIHDMGESMHPEIAKRTGEVVGDIPAGKKIPAQRLAEARVRHFLYEELFADVHPETLSRVEGLIMHMPQQGDEHLYEITELAHELTTFNTAVRAKQAWEENLWQEQGDAIQIDTYDGGRKSALLGLHRSVFIRSGRNLLEKIDEHPYVGKVLQEHLHDLKWSLNTHSALKVQAANAHDL